MITAQNWMLFQPLIVGLGAVVLASLGNTLLEWFRQHHRHRREARGLRRAFLEELIIQRRMHDGAMSADQREEKEGSLLIPVERFMPVYDSMIGKVGVLEPDEIGAIMHAYSLLILNPKNLGVLGQLKKDEFSSWLVVSVEYTQVIASMYQSLVEACDAAIEVLAKRSPKTART